jgi:CheY-like chemotaxis protein
MGTQGTQASRILIVDDDPFVLESILWVLKPAGYDVVKAGSPEEALAFLNEGRFGLVLLDYSMPKMRGDELAAVIKERSPGLPIIMLTAYAEMMECSLTPITGIEQVLCKPFLAGDLRQAVARYLLPPR